MSDSPAVRVRDVVRTFGAVRALDGANLDVQAGTIYGLLGPNGAGKTTLIRVLCTLLPADSGLAEVAGVNVAADPVEARKRIGLAGQFAAVDEYLTGRENVAMIGRLYGLSRTESRRRTDEVLERIGLADVANRRAGTYSGGMRRRLDLASSLVGRPAVMFLDEPTTGIDPRSRLELWEMLEDLVTGGTTVLLTTQYLEEADRLANRIGVIHKGRIVREGTADELKVDLGGAVIELATAEAQRSRAMSALETINGEPPVYDAARNRIRVQAPDGSSTLLAAVRALDAAGIEASDVTLHKPTLDDVFLNLTGDAVAATPGEGEQA